MSLSRNMQSYLEDNHACSRVDMLLTGLDLHVVSMVVNLAITARETDSASTCSDVLA